MAMKPRSRKGEFILPGTKTLLAFCLILQCTFSAAQVNPRQLDSLSRAIEDKSRTVMKWQDSFQHRQDSLYRAGIAKAKKGKTTESSSSRGMTMPVLLLAVLLTMLVLVVLRRKNR